MMREKVILLNNNSSKDSGVLIHMKMYFKLMKINKQILTDLTEQK